MKLYHQKHTKFAVGLIGVLLIASITACTADQAPIAAAVEPTAQEIVVEEPVEEAIETDPLTEDFTIVDEEGSTAIDTDALAEELPMSTNGELSQVEIEGLLYMREEEKLARDVYLTLYDQYQLNIFFNIANSEQSHADSVKFLLDLFGLDDPMSTDEVGVFQNETLQQLYDDLIATGSKSLGDAIKVGAAIEEIDILDLEDYITRTDNIDIQVVYENLAKGSRNHLRSFVGMLERQVGETYVPQYLTMEAYEAIIAGDIETIGDGTGQGGRNGNGNGNGGN